MNKAKWRIHIAYSAWFHMFEPYAISDQPYALRGARLASEIPFSEGDI